MSISLAEIKRRVEAEQAPVLGEELKTAAMYRIERKFGADIYVLLAASRGTGRVLARRYGVSESVVSKWRSKLGIVVVNPTSYRSKT